MCGRFALDKKTDELIRVFAAEGNDFEEWVPKYSIAPTDSIPIIRERKHSDSGEVMRSIDAAVWDFHPAFIKESKRPQFNARIEAVSSNGLWKGAFAGSRCIVPMRGYYEWSELDEHGKKVKQPYFIHGYTSTLAAAGISAVRKVDEEWVVSTAIITNEGHDASGEVHDRMPVFLTPHLYDEWLNPHRLSTDAEKNGMLALLRTSAAGVAATMATYEVDRRMNNTHTADPLDSGLISPVDRA